MFKNYFTIAWRNIVKNPVYNIINIFGLAVGIASFLLIAIYIADELSYDRFHENPQSLFRVITEYEISANGNITYVYVFSAIAVLIVLIACINFMNLAVARSMKRAKEISMRKAIGADRWRLVYQFLGESLLFATGGLIFSALIIKLALPLFNALSGKEFNMDALASPSALVAILVFTAFVGIVAGSYPAFFLSALDPIRCLAGENLKIGAKAILRKSLVVFQFVISALCIAGTLLICKQLDFIQTKDLGFDKEAILVVPLDEQRNQLDFETYKKMVLVHPNVFSICASRFVPGSADLANWQVTPEGYAAKNAFPMDALAVDFDFFETYQLKITKGRAFSKDYGSDQEQAFILNEAAVAKIGWDEPVGKSFAMRYHNPANNQMATKSGTVVGVVKNLHFNSLHNPITPMFLRVVEPSYYVDFYSIKVNTAALPETIDFLKKVWQAFCPQRPFVYTFLDENLAQLYEGDEKLGKLTGLFSAVAIVIACLGLFGLASITSEQRTKEFAIRKVLGGKLAHIVALVAKEFSILVIIANFIAVPLAYWLLSQWLACFAYRIDIGSGMFVLTLALTLLLALLTVGYHALSAGSRNPVEALKYNE